MQYIFHIVHVETMYTLLFGQILNGLLYILSMNLILITFYTQIVKH